MWTKQNQYFFVQPVMELCKNKSWILDGFFFCLFVCSLVGEGRVAFVAKNT